MGDRHACLRDAQTEQRVTCAADRYDGSRNAISSPLYPAPLTATTMYCRPFSMYDIGDPVWGAGRYTAPTSFPVALSYARSMAPRAPVGVGPKPASPETTSVLVVM